MGYKTCHVLNSSLDATVCAKDCDRLKKQDFAKKCEDKGGLYKCCIRRDAAFCHECRYLLGINMEMICNITFKGSAVHCPSAPTLPHIMERERYFQVRQIKEMDNQTVFLMTR